MSYADAARYLGLPSVAALRNMVYRRDAPPSFVFGKRDRRFLVADLDRWLAEKRAVHELSQAVAAAETPAPPRRRGRPTKLEQAARRLAGAGGVGLADLQGGLQARDARPRIRTSAPSEADPDPEVQDDATAARRPGPGGR